MSLISNKVAKNFSISINPQKTSLILKGEKTEGGWMEDGRQEEGGKQEERVKEEEGGRKREASMGGKKLEMIDEREEILKEKGKGFSSNEVLQTKLCKKYFNLIKISFDIYFLKSI